MARPFRLRAPRRSPEADLQQQVASNLRAYLPDAVWFTASLSGVRLTPGIAGRAKAAGMNRGAPDLSFVWPDGVTTYIELKAKDGRLSPEQADLTAVLGANIATCRTWPEVKARVGSWLETRGLAWLTDTESVRREGRRRAA